MKNLEKNVLKTTLFIDFLITLGFGLVSYLSPKGTFGTLINLSQKDESLILSLLSSLSIFYILIGLTCLVGFKAKYPTIIFIGFIMILRHGWIGIIGILGFDNKNEWLIGSLTPDIIIHMTFVLFYIIGIYFSIKSNKIMLKTTNL